MADGRLSPSSVLIALVGGVSDVDFPLHFVSHGRSAMEAPRFAPPPNAEEANQFSPIDNEPLLHLQRVLHLAPEHGLGVVRRAIFFALLTWAPIAIWSLVRGRFVDAAVGEPLLQHYGVHVRCLVAIPMFILGEATLHRAALRYFPQFVTAGIVDDVTRPRFEAAVRTLRRWRGSSIPWLLVIGVALAVTFVDRTPTHADEMSWAVDWKGGLGFGGIWFAYVVRPIFVSLLLGWLWRIALLALMFARLSRIGLSLVPSHPDRAGGLGFLEKLPSAFGPVSFGLSAMLASHWAHQVVHHGMDLSAIKVPAAVFVVVWSLLLLAPLGALMPVLHSAKRAALPSYSAMVAEQGRLVRQRWIDSTTKSDAPLLEPAGVGPICDAAAMYGQVKSMRILPIGKTSLIAVLLPIVVPMLIVVTLKIPIGKLLLGLVKTLM
jgi:hypothetical protein